VKQRILDDAEGRRALWAELQFALDGEPDPWFEFSQAQVDLRQFEALSTAPLNAPSSASSGASLSAALSAPSNESFSAP
jgi:nitrite reductase (NADH) large subunit